jgi:hypothetical protein
MLNQTTMKCTTFDHCPFTTVVLLSIITMPFEKAHLEGKPNKGRRATSKKGRRQLATVAAAAVAARKQREGSFLSSLLAGNGGNEDVNMVEAPASSSAEAPASSDERCDDGDEDTSGSSSCGDENDYVTKKRKRNRFNKRDKRRTLAAEREIEDEDLERERQEEDLALCGFNEEYYEEHCEDDYVAPTIERKERKKKPTMQERKDAGFLVCNQTEARTYIFVAYVNRFKEPATPDWPEHISTLAKETNWNGSTVRQGSLSEMS